MAENSTTRPTNDAAYHVQQAITQQQLRIAAQQQQADERAKADRERAATLAR